MRDIIISITIVLFSCGPAGALGLSPRSGGWVPNGEVNAVVATSTEIFIGGDFTCLSPYTGGGVPIDAATGSPAGTFPNVNGFVYAAAPDGSGGWYVGGEFTEVGGLPRNNLCHIVSGGSVDAAWAPGADGVVHVICVVESNLYVGGAFTLIGGQSRNYLAVLNASTGSVEAWDANADGAIYTLCISGNTLYVGGEFSSIGGASRGRIAALDKTTGTATGWDPSASSRVRSIALDGGTVFAGGDFTNIGDQPRNRIAALSAATGLATAWNAGANSCVNAIVVSNGVVYAGGAFSNVGGQPCSKLAAIDLATGAAENWNANSPVYSLAISGGCLYVGGAFSAIGGEARNCLAAIDTGTGAVTTWNPTVSSIVQTLAISGSTIYAGGMFNGVGGVVRRRLAALDAATGEPTDWDPDAGGHVYALALSADKVYAGGVFYEVGGQSREFLAALDRSSGAPTEWAGSADNEVTALCYHEGVLYVGGGFSQIAGESRSFIATLDAATGAATVWNPGADNTVYSLAASGSVVYAGGGFYNIGGQSRMCMAGLNVADGAVTAFDPNLDNSVRAIAVSGGTVYAGGNFTSAGGTTRNRIAALNAATGTVTSWNPNADGSVYAIAVAGTGVYAGGEFAGIGGSAASKLALLDAGTGLAAAWMPNPNNAVWAMAVAPDTLNVGGAFTRLGSVQQEYFAQFETSIAAPANPGAAAIGLNSITWTWAHNSGDETGFNVYVDAGAGPPATPRHTTPANVQSWQNQPLSPNSQYAFQVAATNGTVESQKTATYSTWTLIQPVTGLMFSSVTQTAIDLSAQGTFSYLAAGTSGLRFQNTTQSTDSGWRQHNNAWTSSGLQPNTQYSFTGQSRNGGGSATTAAIAAKYTLAAVPAALIPANPTISTIDVAIGSSDGNPSSTTYAIHVAPSVAGNEWVQTNGGVAATSFYQAAAAWGTATVMGLTDGTLYTFAAKARNGEGVETALGPSAASATLADTTPSLSFTLLSESETGGDVIEFRVEIDEIVVPEFSATAVVLDGLPGTVAVTGAFSVYTVTVNLANPDSDGTVSITVPADVLYDLDGNPCHGGTSDVCHVYNWRGFAEEPAPVAAYTADLVTFSATAACGASCVTYNWKWENGSKVVFSVGGNSPLLLLESVTESHEGSYWCDVSYDGAIHATPAAVLSVKERVVVLPLEPPTVGQGEACTFAVSAAGGYPPLTYAWAKDGTSIQDANAAVYTTPPLAPSDSGSTYTVTVTDSNNDAQSVSVQVTVTPAVPAAGMVSLLALLLVLSMLFRRNYRRD